MPVEKKKKKKKKRKKRNTYRKLSEQSHLTGSTPQADRYASLPSVPASVPVHLTDQLDLYESLIAAILTHSI